MSSFPCNRFYLVTARLHLRSQDQGRHARNNCPLNPQDRIKLGISFLARAPSCLHAGLGTLDTAIRDGTPLFVSQQLCCSWWNRCCVLSPWGGTDAHQRPAFVQQSIKCHHKAWEGAKINDKQFAQFSKWLQHIRFYVTHFWCVSVLRGSGS